MIVAAEPITDIDTTGADMLTDLLGDLEREGTDLAFAELKGPVKDMLRRYDLFDRVGDDRFFPTLGTAIDAYLDAHRRRLGRPGPTPLSPGAGRSGRQAALSSWAVKRLRRVRLASVSAVWLPPERSITHSTWSTLAPCSRSWSVDCTTWPPVVMTSSTTSTRRPSTDAPSASLVVP